MCGCSSLSHFPTDVDIMYCGFTMHGGISEEYDSRRQQVFDVPMAVERNKHSFVGSVIRAQLVCCVLQQ